MFIKTLSFVTFITVFVAAQIQPDSFPTVCQPICASLAPQASQCADDTTITDTYPGDCACNILTSSTDALKCVACAFANNPDGSWTATDSASISQALGTSCDADIPDIGAGSADGTTPPATETESESVSSASDDLESSSESIDGLSTDSAETSSSIVLGVSSAVGAPAVSSVAAPQGATTGFRSPTAVTVAVPAPTASNSQASNPNSFGGSASGDSASESLKVGAAALLVVAGLVWQF